MKQTNEVWKDKLIETSQDYDYIPEPRGMKVKEKQPGTYSVEMPAFLSLPSRNVNKSFMFAEAAWILSGSNLPRLLAGRRESKLSS